MIEIISNFDNDSIKIKSNNLNVDIPVVDFAIITALYLEQEVPITELCLCYQEQFG